MLCVEDQTFFEVAVVKLLHRHFSLISFWFLSYLPCRFPSCGKPGNVISLLCLPFCLFVFLFQFNLTPWWVIFMFLFSLLERPRCNKIQHLICEFLLIKRGGAKMYTKLVISMSRPWTVLLCFAPHVFRDIVSPQSDYLINSWFPAPVFPLFRLVYNVYSFLCVLVSSYISYLWIYTCWVFKYCYLNDLRVSLFCAPVNRDNQSMAANLISLSVCVRFAAVPYSLCGQSEPLNSVTVIFIKSHIYERANMYFE